MSPRFVFLQGIRVRSGTNYIAQIVGCHPDIGWVPPRRAEKPTGELPLVRALPHSKAAFDRISRGYIGDDALDFSGFALKQGQAMKDFVASTYSIDSGTIFLKDPSTDGIDLFFDFFPDEKLVILIRDGRDNVSSAVKAAMSKRRGMGAQYEIKKRLNHLSMRDFRGNAKQWALSARRILDFERRFAGTEHASKYLVLRYEDVFNDPKLWARKLFEFIGVSAEDEIVDKAGDVGVVGSSFYGSGGREDAVKPNWKPTPRTEEFRPVERWRSWNAVQKRLFKQVAGDELIALGYATDKDW